MVKPDPFFAPLTAEERAAAEQRRLDSHRLEPGRGYTFRLRRVRVTYSAWRPNLRWEAVVSQSEHPFAVVGSGGRSLTRWGARRWAAAYVQRGGPPESFGLR